MTIETYGSGERIKIAAELVRSLNIEHTVILPIPATKDGIYIKDTDVKLEESLAGVKNGSLVIGYGLPEDYVKSAEEAGAKCLDLLYDEDFLKDNAQITAISALGYILSSIKKEPKDISFGIVGYGRIGSRILDMLLFFGAQTIVYTGRENIRLSLGECGIETREFPKKSEDFRGVDILINTAPADLSCALSGAPRMRIIELASGRNFDGIEGVEGLPALPERKMPEAGGRALFLAIKRFKKRENVW